MRTLLHIRLITSEDLLCGSGDCFVITCKRRIRQGIYTCVYIYIHTCAKSFQSCPTLCNAVDYSPLGCSSYGILQANILMWVAMPSSRASAQPRD